MACKPLVTVPSSGKKIGDLVALEMHAFGIGRQENAKRFQAGVLDLILQIRGHLHLRFADVACCRLVT